jgi:hypothetical protein
VYKLNFPYVEVEKEGEIVKYAVCLQSGSLIGDRRQRFAGALLTTKNLDRRFSWEVFVSAAESHTAEGVRISLGEPQIFMKEWVTEHAYDLSPETMREVDKALLVSLSIALP